MKLRTILWLLSGALTTAAALALPMSAQAITPVAWTYNGVPIETSKTISLSGEVKWENGYGSVACNANVSLAVFPGVGGEITASSLTGCETGGELKEAFSCEAVGSSASGEPWSAWDGGSKGIMVLDPAFVVHMTESCILGEEGVAFETFSTKESPSPMVLTTTEPVDLTHLSVNEEWDSNLGPVEMTASLSPSAGYGLVGRDTNNSADWSEEGLPISSTEHVTMSGPMRFRNYEAGFECDDVEMTATMYPYGFGSAITAASFNDCQLTGALHQVDQCDLGPVQASSLPEEIQRLDSSDVRIPTLEFSSELISGACAEYGEVGGTIELDLHGDNGAEISSFEPSGEAVWGPSGVLSVESPTGLKVTPSGRFGLE